jgi:patatin-like phospholipase
MSDASAKHGPFPLSRVLADECAALHGAQIDFPESASEPERLKLAYKSIHQLVPTRSALCFSGGGIRSATFGLGVVQGLARFNLLGQFDYQSTVSGGGYIGSWLAAWIHRESGGVDAVSAQLGRTPHNSSAPEPEPVCWLRNYSNYLSPRLGLMSADSWTLVGTYLRNLILNWLVLVPFLLALLAVPTFYRATLSAHPSPQLLLTLVALGSLLLLVNLSYLHFCRPSLEKVRTSKKWRWIETQRAFLSISLVPFLIGVSLLTISWEWYRQSGHSLEDFTLFGLSSLSTLALGAAAMHVAAWLIAGAALRRPLLNGWRYLELLTIILSGLIGGGLLWLVLAKLTPFAHMTSYADWYTCAAVPTFLSLFLLAAVLFIGLASRFTGDGDREWWARSGAWVLIGSVSWTAASGIVLFGPWVLAKLPGWVASAGGLAGLFTLLFGFSAKTDASPAPEQSVWWKRLGTTLFLLLLAPFTVVLILAALARVNAAIINYASWLEVGEFILGMALFSVLMSFFININKFSLHSMYRNRLIRAYLGASRGEGRTPNPFTGFDPDDNLEMSELAPKGGPVQKPMPVVNIALNLVHGEKLSWQQRKAESFTVTPLHCGSFSSSPGYRRSSEYGRNPAVDQAITMGTALAISGAAASPNMGYHSSPAITFLLTLFNVRLGWWMGNPGAAGAKTYTRSCPEFAVGPLLAEAFGLTDEHKRYVYLSDGGHFENLGLYEMVLRRCHCILVSDAGCDEKMEFQDLGNAIRKIRIDLGIDITIKLDRLKPLGQKGQCSGHYAVGTIHYTRVDQGRSDGILIYLKPSLTGNEPVDVLEYAAHHRQFPHEPTSDQFFDEAQFESYRRLGEHIVEQVFSTALKPRSQTLHQVFEEFHTQSERTGA